jgi:hypothetical protein
VPTASRNGQPTTAQRAAAPVPPGASPAGVVRRPVLKESHTVRSPADENILFVLRRMGNRERIRRQNMFQSMRYITEEVTGRSIVERDVPMGEIAVQDVLMGLSDWNLTDQAGRPLPITEDTIQDYLEPEEFDFVLDEIRLLNPVVFGGTGERRDGPKGQTDQNPEWGSQSPTEAQPEPTEAAVTQEAVATPA